jgi:DNA polymerase-3 subunit beta
MKFTIPVKNFEDALSRVQGITGGRVSMPVLNNVLLDARPGGIHLSATDLEVGLHTVAGNASVEVPGRTSLHAAKLLAIVKSLVTEDVTLELAENDRVNISAGTAFFTMACLSPDEFPDMPEVDGQSFDLDASALIRLIEHTDYAMSKDEQKYHLCGIYLQVTETKGDVRLAAVATDGHRLGRDTVPLPGDPRKIPKDLARGIIISSKGVHEIKKLQTGGILVFNIAGNNLTIASENETLYLRLVDGSFPDWRRVMPDNIEGTVEVKRGALISALDRVSLFSTDKNRGVAWNIAEGGISLNAQHPELGEASDRVNAAVSCSPREVRFNSGYVNQALAALDCGVVQLHIPVNELNPIKITPTCETEPVAIVMPMRL